MQRIEEQSPDRAELGKEVLAWITCLRQPFKASELRKALGIRVGQSAFDEDDCPDIIDMVSACAGLVTIDEESDIIRLVHYTTQEYLNRTQYQWFPEAERMITEGCIAYLSMDEFGSADRYSGMIRISGKHEQLKGFPGYSDKLYDYAACNWGHHACKAPRARQAVIDFCTLSWNLKCSALMLVVRLSGPRVTYVFLRCNERTKPDEDTTSGFHLSAQFGLRDILVVLLQQGYDINAPDRFGNTALMLAARNGHLETVKLLLSHGARTDLKNLSGYSLLHCAVHSRNIDIVQLVIVDATTGKLMDAIPDGGKDIAPFVYSPLVIAVEREDASLVRLLISYGVDVNLHSSSTPRQRRDSSPLWLAAARNNREILEMLLEAGADINCRSGNKSNTALHVAAFRQDISWVRYLLSQGANINTQDDAGQTPLLYIWIRGTDDTTLSTLLDAGADTNIPDNKGQSVLQRAASSQRNYLIPLLISFGAKVSLISDYELRRHCIDKLRQYLKFPEKLEEDKDEWFALKARENAWRHR